MHRKSLEVEHSKAKEQLEEVSDRIGLTLMKLTA